ncbi:bifunctional adenosylcobinamide kinase/adenosylcobinamide-phosphate guanylyltransferase [Shewanella cyperi]|uniref:Bifunctional adenosylcobalamin biosynthesis protein n=1 Tax=Shewanella cyperi TaxID=2814292 RepID=A0A974XX35_9GAMM|nr:bifunctional adenosylcobinamide kinase/adenosylcobinamide-phosphate guanylyltransferase [Shewanella cyperi]QSX31929.1 bifunctional adenosylcobinamide kinase/adenosylcobinamide-phosphate guanylyltransferase [Shewanella cyperi]QSX40066.1 bifunctional adenosylcobinamide kinase/adenosylcobinamide-phosphate guanylyltransferase [Shewanella cyperi]
MIGLILGGARSGKSRYAEQLLAGRAAVYLATATAGDAEMAERIARHKLDRAGGQWQLLEEPLNVVAALDKLSGRGTPVLLDCLTLWLTNVLLDEGRDAELECRELVAALKRFDGELLLISNEVGSGIVPLGQLSRDFVDRAGWLNQAIAAVADKVVLVVAGLPLPLKGEAL